MISSALHHRLTWRSPTSWITVSLIFVLFSAAMWEAGRVFVGSNQHTVIAGRIYRSAQLSPQQLSQVIASYNIKTVLNLRGVSRETEWYMAESRVTHTANISQEDITLSAYLLPPPAELRRIIDVLENTDYPILIHCKRGADRTGLTSALAILLTPDGTMAEARKQLWPIYGHFALGKTKAMDDFLDLYENWLQEQEKAHSPERLRYWVNVIYVPGPARSQLRWLDTIPANIARDQAIALRIRAVNQSNVPWEFQPGHYSGIHLQYVIANDKLQTIYKGQAGLLRKTVLPGSEIELALNIPPLVTPGRYALVAELIDARGASIPLRANSFVKFGDASILASLLVE